MGLTPVNIFLISARVSRHLLTDNCHASWPDKPCSVSTWPGCPWKLCCPRPGRPWESLTASPGDQTPLTRPWHGAWHRYVVLLSWPVSAKFILPILLATNRFALENFLLNKLPQLSLVLAWQRWQQTWKYFNEQRAATNNHKVQKLCKSLTNQFLGKIQSATIN